MNVRSFLIALLAALLLPVQAIHQSLSPWVPVGRGIEYREFSLDGPNRAYVARMDRRNPTVTIESALAMGAFGKGYETVEDMAARFEQSINFWRDLGSDPEEARWGKRSHVVVAINGSYLDQDNRALPESGMVQSGWYAKRFDDYGGWSGFVWKLDGEAFIGDCVFHPDGSQVIVLPDGSRIEIDAINQSGDSPDELRLFTPQFGTHTPDTGGGIEFVIELSRPLMITPSDGFVEGRVLGYKEGRGGAPIHFDQVVISAGGETAERLRAVLGLGATVQFSQPIGHYPGCKPENGGPLPDWAQAYASIGGAHTFLKGGEVMPHHEDVQRHPRTAVALNDDYIFFIVVDGRWPDVSIGMTIEELGTFARDYLGATDGIAQDGGGSSTLVVNGVVVNNPSDVCYQHFVYLPAVVNQADAFNPEPPTAPPFPARGMTPDRCLRPVANGLMMVEVEPMAVSSLFEPGALVRTTDRVNLRTGPGTNYLVLSEIPPGSDGVVLDHANQLNGVYATGYHWWRVEFNGVQGWIAESFIQPRP